VTDIVEREMYTFPDRNGDSITLRPEATAGIVRAVIEHSLLHDGPKRIWTSGPMFRYERPQKRRYRQFHQIDVEALGFAGPDVDAEQIAMLARLWKQLGITDVELHINSIGDAEARAEHRVDLVKYFEAHLDQLDEDARRRLHSNPLRTLDSKNPRLQHLVEAAPKLIDYLDDAAREHFTALQALLHAAGIGFVVDPRLVRGFEATMKKADASGARFAIIIGPEALAAGEVSLKPLRAADAQVRIAPTRVAGIIQQSV